VEKGKLVNDEIKRLLSNKGEISKMIEGMALQRQFSMPEIRMPRREDDCEAAPVCEAIGNLRKACTKGSMIMTGAGPGLNVCIISIILLMSRAMGMWPQEMIDETEKNRIGFVAEPVGSTPQADPGGPDDES
jgi:hypothetical protein